MTPGSVDLLAATVDDLEGWLLSRARARAVRRHLVEEGTHGWPARIAGVAETSLKRLRASAFVPEWRELFQQTGADGTRKLTLALGDATVETVVIPARGRNTVCVSSQAGCTRRCRFCATARLGVGRNLRAGEIVLQYLLAARLAAGRPPRNVVFMGMGEPLDNLEEVLAAVRGLTDVFPGLSPRHVTVSTAGVLPSMKRFLRESDASLALSLNATTDEQRTLLMPHNRRWPIASLLALLREDAQRHARRCFVEYVLLAGVNDTNDDALRLGAWLARMPVQLNLIPHNPFPGSPFAAPSREATLRFQERLKQRGLRSIVRWPRGADIDGACGQLALRRLAGNAAPA
jgi:23S rRNA (adenine2503-C2)-methyltransferase